jgi:hypothetical protein
MQREFLRRTNPNATKRDFQCFPMIATQLKKVLAVLKKVLETDLDLGRGLEKDLAKEKPLRRISQIL